MKNREKYPKTEDAVKAYEEHKKEHKCDCTFDDWLDTDEDAMKRLVSSFPGLIAGAILAPLFAQDMLKDDAKRSTSSDSSDGETGDLGKCPVCKGDKVNLKRDMIWRIECPDCGLFFGVDVKSYKKEDHDEALISNWRKLQENTNKNK